MTVALQRKPTAYREDVVDDAATWPQVGLDLIDELARSGLVGLITGPPDEVARLVLRLCDELGISAISIGQTLCNRPDPPTLSQIEASLSGATILYDIELLFAPAIHTNVLSFLSLRSKRQPTIAVWPGEVIDRRASYSAPGRSDRQEAALTAAVIIRPTRTRFPDEVPFEIERISR